MSKKQTAVEWLIDKLSSQPIDDINDEFWFGIIGEAKQMEKEQIAEAHNNGKNILPPNENGEQYYNETFKSKS